MDSLPTIVGEGRLGAPKGLTQEEVYEYIKK
jgi:hypothetical protein